MRSLYYILIGHEVVPTNDQNLWAQMWEDKGARRVAADHIGDVFVSTVFMGIDHNFDDSGPPLVFETMVFGLDNDMTRRYPTWDAAEAGHASIVRAVKAIVG